MSGQSLEELKLLNKKLEELFGRYNEVRTKNKELKDENELLKHYLQERDEIIKNLEIKYERIKISGALMGEGGNAFEAKQKITELVREIDRCVALLNR
jgi:predicted nuclease with TOPRIM domain